MTHPAVRLAHLTLATRDVERTAAFFEDLFGFARGPIPGNSPVATQWLDIGGGQQMHLVFVEGFTVSPFEGEFGRHLAFEYPAAALTTLAGRLTEAGAELIPPQRATSFARLFVREPINGYVLEVIGREARP